MTAFHKKNPLILIETESVPFDINNVLKPRFESGEAPDIMMLPSNKILNDFIQSGYVIDLTREKSTSRLCNQIKSDISLKKKVFSYPVNMKGIGLFYNRKFIDRLTGNPDDLIKICKSIKDNTEDSVDPISLYINDNESVLFSLLHSVSLAHSGIDSNDWLTEMNSGNGSFDNDNLKELFPVLKTYLNYEKENSSYEELDHVIRDYNEGKLGMFFGETDISEKLKIETGFGPLPLSEKKPDNKIFCDTEASIVISSKSMPEKIEAAKKLLEFLSSDIAVRMLSSECKFIPAVKNADVSSLDMPGQNLYKNIQDNRTIPYVFNLYPSGVNEKIGMEMNNFLKGKLKYDAFIKLLDDEWKKNITME